MYRIIFMFLCVHLIGASHEEVEQIDMTIYFSNYKWLIFPGTKWCGTGNNAKDYNDLGVLKDTDECCRTHDHCPDSIWAGKSKYNLTNTSNFTRSSCSCDNEFYDCLIAEGSSASDLIGRIYFNSIRSKCFEENYPATCISEKCMLSVYPAGPYSKCVSYNYDGEKKEYQFFDVKQYKNFDQTDEVLCN